MKLRLIVFALVAILTTALALAGCKAAQTGEGPQEFFKGKTITIIVPFAPGGGMDTQARIISQYLVKYTGAASVVVENMAGGSGMKGMNYTFTTAKPDGLTLVTFPGTSMLLAQLFGEAEAKYDIPAFSWVGRLYMAPWVIGISKDVSANPADLKQLKPFKLGISTIGMQSLVGSVFANSLDLDNTKIIAGYGGTKEVALAASKGEVHALALNIGPLQMFVDQGLMKLACIITESRFESAPNVPTIFEVAKGAGINMTPEKAKWVKLVTDLSGLDRIIAGPPNIPEARLKYLQDVFIKVVEEKAYQKEMKDKDNADIKDYAHGKDLQKLAKSLKDSMTGGEIAELKRFVNEKYFK